jgi:hypothetical protein
MISRGRPLQLITNALISGVAAGSGSRSRLSAPRARAHLLQWGSCRRAASIGSEDNPGNVPDAGEIRMRFRRTGSPTRFLFFIEALYPRDRRTPNFSGFSARGSAKINPDGSCSARYDTWVVKLCDDSWSLWV